MGPRTMRRATTTKTPVTAQMSRIRGRKTIGGSTVCAWLVAAESRFRRPPKMTTRPSTAALLVSVTLPPKTRTLPATEPSRKTFPANTRTPPVPRPSIETEHKKQLALWNDCSGARTMFRPKRTTSCGECTGTGSDGAKSRAQRTKRRGSMREGFLGGANAIRSSMLCAGEVTRQFPVEVMAIVLFLSVAQQRTRSHQVEANGRMCSHTSS
jgi:hypothetical protein